MCLIAIPFAIRHNRSGGIVIGIGISIIIGIIYFVMLSLGVSLRQRRHPASDPRSMACQYYFQHSRCGDAVKYTAIEPLP